MQSTFLPFSFLSCLFCRRFIGGHSLGGLVAALAVARDPAPWKAGGLLLLAPAVDVERTLVMKLQEPFAQLLSILIPDASIVPGGALSLCVLVLACVLLRVRVCLSSPALTAFTCLCLITCLGVPFRALSDCFARPLSPCFCAPPLSLLPAAVRKGELSRNSRFAPEFLADPLCR